MPVFDIICIVGGTIAFVIQRIGTLISEKACIDQRIEYNCGAACPSYIKRIG